MYFFPSVSGIFIRKFLYHLPAFRNNKEFSGECRFARPIRSGNSVSEFLQYTDNIEIYWILNSPRKWNNGMVEHWNIGFQKDISHFNFIANPVGGGTINPTLHYPRSHYSYIPVFHHSN